PGSSSASSAMSQMDSESSAEDAATHDSSDGCHSTLVMASRCQLKLAAGEPDLKLRRSHTLMLPSSAPDTSRFCTRAFQSSTLTSERCAATHVWHRSLTRQSQMRIVLSLEAEANTCSSEGDHTRSSTLEEWPL